MELTMLLGDRVAGDVETSHPEVGGNTMLPGNIFPIQDVATEERDQVPIKEPAGPRNLDIEATVKTSDSYK